MKHSPETHTPGPWAVDYNGTRGHIKSLGYPGSTPTVARYDIAGVSVTAEAQEANAHLIAASPDLLAALESRREADEACDALNAYREIDGHDEAEAHRMHVKFFELADKAVQMSEAAIKKARNK